MDIKELDKKQLILLVLLITFIVSIATGIITVSLMKQMPTSVPQTINNVIQRTIEKVTTVEVPAPVEDSDVEKNNQNDAQNQDAQVVLGDKDSLISIYLQDKSVDESVDETTNDNSKIESIGQGIIISDVGLILIDSNLVNDTDSYKVILSGKDYGVSVLKKFNNGFSILKISLMNTTQEIIDTTNKTQQ